MKNISPLQKARYAYKPVIPQLLMKNPSLIELKKEELLKNEVDERIKNEFAFTHTTQAVTFKDGKNPQALKPRNVGVLLSGGQAPGGHNVVAGLFDAICESNPESKLIGFHLGPSGLVNGDYEILTKEIVDSVRNTGGFDIIGCGRTKIETDEQIEKAVSVIKSLNLDSLVIIGGDDSNTNAAILAEVFKKKEVPCQVIGIPKTIDGDLKNEYIEASFGFDTATKFYSSVIGSLARDTMSSKKYWNFVKLMGRSASHIALECALQIQPNVCLIGEEIKQKGASLAQVIDHICDVISKRALNGENYGLVLIPEGIVEFIPETANLILELNINWQEFEKVYESLKNLTEKKAWLKDRLTLNAFATLCELPDEIAEQFLALRDPHGNIIVSKIETEKLFIGMIQSRLLKMRANGEYSGHFSPMAFFYGYEGRCVMPSNFDSNYCYALGRTAFLLIANGLTGYIATVRNLEQNAENWICGGIPLTMMMNVEIRKGVPKPVIEKSLVDLNGKPFLEFAQKRDEWAFNTEYVFTGPIQYFGPSECCDRITRTLQLEKARG
ncbi:diphosphate--fructose-6-phosphate 1-phosphotransferase [Treponema zioleckii]|uniref:diphosphate--fructose-6-phosphate 1-phosphotransferase n=1 Tax=Treponema zioleckii TaxID=331680 RepID=UPI00168B3E57|nr:diphosphate--fructose-6-phosphate 1-phosphotransferase [Treponema zioleckii]